MAASKSFNKILAGMHTESFAVSKYVIRWCVSFHVIFRKAESIYMTEFATRVAVFSESVISKLCDQSPDRDLLRVYDLCFVTTINCLSHVCQHVFNISHPGLSNEIGSNCQVEIGI